MAQTTLPYDLLELIFNKFDIKNQIRFKQINTSTNEIQITNFNFSNKKNRIITNKTLQKYNHISRLIYSVHAFFVTDLNFLSKLQILDINGFGAPLNQNSISNLYSLTELNLCATTIYDLNHMVNLQKLTLYNNTFVEQSGITKQILHISNWAIILK